MLVAAGLEAFEARTYTALLEMGEGSVLNIAVKAKLNRTTLYAVLRALESKGLVVRVRGRKGIRFIPEKPAVFLDKIRANTDALSKKFEAFPPEFTVRGKPRIYFLSGSEGFKKVWKAIFSSGVREYLIITDAREMLGFVREAYITDWVIREKVKLGIQSRQLISSSEFAKKIVVKDKKNRTSKLLPHMYKVPVTTLIFGNNVAFIPPRDENLIFMIVESEPFAKAQRILFDIIWNCLPSASV